MTHLVRRRQPSCILVNDALTTETPYYISRRCYQALITCATWSLVLPHFLKSPYFIGNSGSRNSSSLFSGSIKSTLLACDINASVLSFRYFYLTPFVFIEKYTDLIQICINYFQTMESCSWMDMHLTTRRFQCFTGLY